jgi:hypothetical protein
MGIRSLLVGVCVALASAAPQAAVVSLTPISSTLSSGQSVVVEVVVSGLDSGQALAGFDLDLVYDPGVLAVRSATFGGALGAEGVDLFSSAVLSAGRADLAAVSLLAELDLLALQTTSFSIATLVFDALAPGFTDIRFDTSTFPGLLLSDAFGLSIAASVGGEAGVTVTGGGGGSVPVPGSLALAGLALALALSRPRPTPPAAA